MVLQKMALGAIGEVLLGYRVYPQVGPMVPAAAEGASTELLQDRAIRMAPVDLQTVRAVLAELRALALLTWFRGQPRGDEAVAHAIVAPSSLALSSVWVAVFIWKPDRAAFSNQERRRVPPTV
jgi:acetate---CoA ligase (ADP-forming)